MAPENGCLVDTNILLRIPRRDDPAYTAILNTISRLRHGNVPLFYSLQNIAEFWNVSTRPIDRNGYGLSIPDVESRVKAIKETMTLLPENILVFDAWHRLVLEHQIRGVKVHDARLAALMQVHGVGTILTLNAADFRRFPDLTILTPTI